MKQVTFRDRIRYRFDNFMSRGTIALIGGLAVLSMSVIFIAAIMVKIIDARQEGALESITFREALWLSMMRTLDAGTMGGDTGWRFRFVMFFVTLGGVFVISMLIGILTSGLEGRLTELRKGRSRVIEKNHTVILGWSAQIFSIISELVVANANQKNSCIVILGEKDRDEMEDAIRENVGDTGKTRIIYRTGNPNNLVDLEIVSLHTSKSIILLSASEDNPDIDVIKALLAITQNPGLRGDRTIPFHIVAEIRDQKNMDVARMVGKDEVELILIGDLISRIIAQTSRQPGLSIVYTELLDFSGDEIYIRHEPTLAGKTFGEALLCYEDSTVLGLVKAGEGAKLKPPMDTVLGKDDQIIAISEDDDTVRLSGLRDYMIDEGAIQTKKKAAPTSEMILVLGWNWRTPLIVKELDHYVTPGSRILVVADQVVETMWEACQCETMQNLQVSFQRAQPDDRGTLDGLDIQRFHNVIVLSNDGYKDPQQADASTLVTLLHLRDIAEKCQYHLAVVSEMLDLRNRELAEVTKADDFIVSDTLVSLMLSQVSENKYLNVIFADIFDPEGSEIYIKPALNYVKPGQPVNFYTVVEAARRQNEVAIGYCLQALRDQSEKAHGVTINPDKSQKVVLTEFDRIIVVAEE
jgi:hypothetical protein